MINMAYDSESDSSEVDFAGCDFYQNIEKKYEKKNKTTTTNKETKKEKCILS